MFNLDFSITRTIAQPWGYPLVDVSILPHKLIQQTVLDTASPYNLISPALVKQLGLNPIQQQKIPVTHPITGDSAQPLYVINFLLENCPEVFKVQEFVKMPIENFDFPLVLGNIFLRQCKEFKYIGSEGRIVLNL